MKAFEEALQVMVSSGAPDPVVMQGITEIGIEVVHSEMARAFICAMVSCYASSGEFPLLAFGLSCFASGVRVGMEMEKVDL